MPACARTLIGETQWIFLGELCPFRHVEEPAPPQSNLSNFFFCNPQPENQKQPFPDLLSKIMEAVVLYLGATDIGGLWFLSHFLFLFHSYLFSPCFVSMIPWLQSCCSTGHEITAHAFITLTTVVFWGSGLSRPYPSGEARALRVAHGSQHPSDAISW